MSSSLANKGIYHNLPTFPQHDGKKYTAIVTGANGITGSAIVDVLAASPERWGTIYAMSRKPGSSKHANVKNIAADFLQSPESLAELFTKSGVKADYIFFASYVQPPPTAGQALWGNVDEMETANLSLLTNFLSALSLSSIIPKRFLLQTGGKHYALHLGPAAVPMMEDSPRVDHPNFYFPQEDALSAWSTKHSTHWTVTRPGFILGAVKEASMNITFALAIYASIQKQLGQPLNFPADIGAWDANKDLSAVKLIAYFEEWAVLTEAAADQALNIVDDSRFSYGGFWPVLAGWYGLSHGIPEADEQKYLHITMPRSPAPRGFGPPGLVNVTWNFESWAAKDEVKAAWKKIQQREGLDPSLDPWRNPKALQECWGTLDAEVLGSWARLESMDKAKMMGWTGFVDSKLAIREAIGGLAELKMVPGVPGA